MVKVKFIVFNATFYNTSVISQRSVVSVEDNWVPREKSLIKITTWCSYLFFSWVRNKLEKFFKHKDKSTKLQGLSVRDWISDNRVWKYRATVYLSRNIFSRTKLCIYKLCYRYTRSTVFVVLKRPTKNDIYELFITKWTSITMYPRTPEVDDGVS
jgi:hypothetical protein